MPRVPGSASRAARRPAPPARGPGARAHGRHRRPEGRHVRRPALRGAGHRATPASRSPWDALERAGSPRSSTTWMQAAPRRGRRAAVSFGHSRTEPPRASRRPERFRSSSAASAPRYPWVSEFAAWNEANHCGEPTCHRPALVAALLPRLRRECPTCRILAAEVLDMPNMVSLGARVPPPRAAASRATGACTTTSTPTASGRRARARLLPRRPGPDLVHRDGRHRLAPNRGQGDASPSRPSTRPRRRAGCFDRSCPLSRARHARLHLPLERTDAPRTTWDSALIGPDRPRRGPAFTVAAGELRAGRRRAERAARLDAAARWRRGGG